MLYNYRLVNIVNLGSWTNQYFWEMGECSDDRFYGILCYDEYREFTGVTGDIQGFLDII